MPIIEEYDAIARRLRELRTVPPKSAKEISDFERWRILARETAEKYLEGRRGDAIGDSPIVPRRF